MAQSMADLLSEAANEIVGLFKIKVDDVAGVALAFLLVQVAKYIVASPMIANLGEVAKSAQLWAILLGMVWGNVPFLAEISAPEPGLMFCKKMSAVN